jgi:hypothetical protein
VVRPIQAHQSTIQVNDENHMANECNGGARGRITRAMKRRKKQARYQGRPLQFRGGDDDGRPRLDDHSILDPNGSQRTRRIVIKNDILHLQSGLPKHDDELSTDDSNNEERNKAPEDPTYRKLPVSPFPFVRTPSLHPSHSDTLPSRPAPTNPRPALPPPSSCPPPPFWQHSDPV